MKDGEKVVGLELPELAVVVKHEKFRETTVTVDPDAVAVTAGSLLMLAASADATVTFLLDVPYEIL